MLSKIISFSVKNKLIIGLFVSGLIGLGIFELGKLPIDAVPDITDNQVQVITVAPSLGAPDVERLITFPIEQANCNIPGIKKLRSFSRFGLSVVTIVFDESTDIYWARQQVAERLLQVKEQIPVEFGIPALAPVTTGLGEIYQYTVRAEKGYEDKYSSMDLRVIQDWVVRRQLLGVKGVAEVSSFGGLLKQYEISIVPSQLQAYGITITDVFTALENNNQNTGGAYIERGETALFIRSEGLVAGIEDIRDIVIKKLPDGTPLCVRNVAEVNPGHATQYGAMTYNGEQDVSGAVVMMLKGANSNEVIANIKQRISEIQKNLPEGVVIDPFLDRTKMVNYAIGTVSKNLVEGALIVVFVLVIFLGNLRAGLLVASVIPLSMLFAVIMMNMFGVSGNLMSLGALDFGLIVDGAVIIVEAVMHRLTHSKSAGSQALWSKSQMNSEVTQSASRMMNSAVFGQMIILIVYLPIFALQGIEGKMFKPMAQTVAFALLGAFLLSLTYIPMMSALVLSRKNKHTEGVSDRWMNRLSMVYHSNLIRVLRNQRKVFISVALLFGFAVILLLRMGGEFIPVLPEGDFAVETRVLPGSNIHTSTDAVSRASKLLLGKFPEIEKIVGKTGSSEVPTDPMPMDASDLMIILKDRSQWKSAKTYQELEYLMSKELESIPGVTWGFQYPVAMRFNELISGARQDVVIKIYGENLDTLTSYAEKLGAVCNETEGSSALYVESITGMPQIVIRYNRKVLAQYGLQISQINNAVKSAFAGAVAGTVYEGEKRFDLVVRMAGTERKGLDNVRELLISTPSGMNIPLSMVANVEVIDGPNQIQRENSQRRIIVGFNVRGRDVQSLVKELQSKVDKKIKLPPGYFITYGGSFENLQEAKARLYWAVPVSLILILLLLYLAFKSLKQGLLIYSAIPLSAMGGIFALAMRGIPFSVSAGVGFIALFGVAVLNGIVLIAEFNRLREQGFSDVKRIVIIGTRTRLRPVLMTAMVASLGFLPMALSQGEGAEVQRPLATVVIGGLLIATFLTLFLLPCLYLLFHNKPEKSSMKSLKTAAVLLLLFSVHSLTNAQIPVTYLQALDTAVKYNATIRNEKLATEVQKNLIKTAWDIPSTSVSGQFGQFNSIYRDNQFSVSQSMSFPAVYVQQRQLYGQLYLKAVQNRALKLKDLKLQLGQTYVQLSGLSRKKALLLRTDSLYRAFLERADKRLEAGETSVLEKIAAESQLGQIRIQLNAINADIEAMQSAFQLLLNTENLMVPDSTFYRFDLPELADTSALLNHPRLRLLQSDIGAAECGVRLEKAKMLPGLNFGFVNTSIRGVGADNRFYTSANRFRFVQLGIEIPLNYQASGARISALRINSEIAGNSYNAELKKIKAELSTLLMKLGTQTENLNYYEKTALPNARKMAATANAQFSSGEINFLGWSMLINQSLAVVSDYENLLMELNLNVLQLNYLSNEND